MLEIGVRASMEDADIFNYMVGTHVRHLKKNNKRKNRHDRELGVVQVQNAECF